MCNLKCVNSLYVYIDINVYKYGKKFVGHFSNPPLEISVGSVSFQSKIDTHIDLL